MARPEEKAMAMLNKWTKMKNEHDTSIRSGASIGSKLQGERRPYLSSLASSLSEAEHWRKDIIREITQGVANIQNKGMSEPEVRDLNDRINKLLREKHHWNKRVKELGGTDYNKLERNAERNAAVSEGGSLQGSGMYKYFGAAKDLPGVRELFAKEADKAQKKRQTSGSVYKSIDAAYYGFRDEESGVLLEEEEEEERKRRKIYLGGEDTSDSDDGDFTLANLGGLTAAEAMPSQTNIDSALLALKKQELMASLG